MNERGVREGALNRFVPRRRCNWLLNRPEISGAACFSNRCIAAAATHFCAGATYAFSTSLILIKHAYI